MALKFCKNSTYRLNSFRTPAFCLVLLLLCSAVSGETVLAVGCDKDYPPFSVAVGNGVTGFDADFIHHLARAADFTPEFVPCSWASVLQSLENGDLDLVTAIIHTDQRSEKYDFTIPYITDYYTLFSREDSGITVPEDTDGKILAILRDDAALERFIIPAGLDKQLILTETYTEAMQLVQQGSADYTLAPYSLGKKIIGELAVPAVRATGRNLFPISYRLAVKKGDKALLFRLNDAIVVLSRNGVLSELRKKWFPGTPENLPANHPARRLFARIFVNIFGAMVLVGVSYLSSRLVLLRQMRKIRDERDSLYAVIDTVPVGLRWHNLVTGVFSENRFWREACARMKNYRADETSNPEVQHFIGSDGGENWVRFRRTSVLSEKGTVPLNVFLMEDITDIRLLEDTLGKLAGERTQETARLLVESMADPDTGLFSADFLAKRLRAFLSGIETQQIPFTMVCFSVYLGDFGADTKFTAATVVREAVRRIDYPGYSRSGRLVILLPESDYTIGENCAARICTGFETARLIPGELEYRILTFPGTESETLLQSIDS